MAQASTSSCAGDLLETWKKPPVLMESFLTWLLISLKQMYFVKLLPRQLVMASLLQIKSFLMYFQLIWTLPRKYVGGTQATLKKNVLQPPED